MNRPIGLAQGLLAVATMAAMNASLATQPYFAVPPNPQYDGGTQASSQYVPNYFSVISAQGSRGGAVTCTNSTIMGNVGSSGLAPSVVLTGCPVSGHVVAPITATVIAQFHSQFDQLGNRQCEHILTGTMAGVTLHPGVYCFRAAASLTGTATLIGPATGTWIFLVNGDLTGNSFTVVMAAGGKPCNVAWESSGTTTMNTSDVKGNFWSGQGMTFTGGTLVGRAFSKKAVTLTNVAATGCGF